MGTITISCIQRAVMYKSFKVFIDEISYHYFFGMSIYMLTTFIVRKTSFETSCTISIVFRRTRTAINPIYTIRTSVTASVCYTFIGFALGTCTTIRFNTSFTASVCYTFIGFALGTCTTIRFNTSFTATVSFTFIGFADGT